MGGFHSADEQGRLVLFPGEENSNVKYYEYSTYINPDLWNEFFEDFNTFAKDITKFDVGVFYLIKCKVPDVFEAEKKSKKYFTYPGQKRTI
jgi:hypothetical protein